MSSIYAAKVKSVLSGDTVVLVPSQPAPGTRPSERILSLAYVAAPRLRREEGDEPHAFASRELLRSLTVGKEVRFQVLYTVTSTSREYGTLYLPGHESVVEKLISGGAVKLRQPGGKEPSEIPELIEKYKSLEDIAKDQAVGVWGTSDHISVVYDLPANFIESNKDKPLDAIIERVINGDRLIVRYIVSPTSHVQVATLIGGIKAPRSPSETEQGEPFGDLAKLFVETRILNRRLKVNVVGLSQQGVAIGIVIHPAGNIAEKLLEVGLAQVSDWQSNFLGAANMSKLRQAEQSAKAKGLHIWNSITISRPTGSQTSETDKNFTAIVARIISADTLVLRMKSNEERVVQLASVRGPRQADSVQASYVNAAREFVRKKCIGKHVKVSVIHRRPKSENFDARDMALVELPKSAGSGSTDLASIIVENGYATVIRHRKGESDDRSPIWDLLLEKESSAIQAKLGIHSGVALPPERIVNASESQARASAFLPSLLRQKRVPAIVEFVNSGSRLRLLLPRDNARIKFVLAGVSTPRVAMTNTSNGGSSEKSEPFGEESRDFSARRLLQRDVEIDVTHADHSGGFIGLLHIPGTKDTFAKTLLEEGLARLDEYSAQQASVFNQLRAAEESAQQQKKGIWKEEKGKAKAVEAVQLPTQPTTTTLGTTSNKQYLNVVVTNVARDGAFSYVVTDSIAKLQQYTRDLTTAIVSLPILSGKPRVNELVCYPIPGVSPSAAGRFKVLQFDSSTKTATLCSVDLGITVPSAPFSKIKSLPAQFGFAGTSGMAAQAKSAKLEYLRWPTFNEDYLDYSIDVFADMVVTEPSLILKAGKLKSLIAIIDGTPTSDGSTSVTLFDAENMDESINSVLCSEGWVYIGNDKQLRRNGPVDMAQVKELRSKIEEAKSDHKGIWEYGDMTPEED
ncbi:hypothetical protein V1511DRAFT_485243 [Dipodascopsis uninucleata]